MKAVAFALLLTMLTLTALAAEPLAYRNAQEEQRFRALAAELRCVMCQNQSLADSDAQIASDLRKEILLLMREGKSDAEIKRFLVARYSDFVLYRPELKPSTWLLWFGPGLLLLGGATAVFVIVRKRSRDVPASPVSGNEQEW